jgi:hypothetical protein
MIKCSHATQPYSYELSAFECFKMLRQGLSTMYYSAQVKGVRLMSQRREEELTLKSSQAALFADEIVGESIPVLELRLEPGSAKGQQAQPAYALGRNQALTRGKGGYTSRSILEVQDPNTGRGETSEQLLTRRLK